MGGFCLDHRHLKKSVIWEQCNMHIDSSTKERKIIELMNERLCSGILAKISFLLSHIDFFIEFNKVNCKTHPKQ